MASIQAATPSPVAFEPTYEVVDCPEDVVSQSLSDVECGYLTVLEDRSDPAGATIRLFTTKTDPPGGTTTPDPAFGGAGNLGADNGPSDDSAGAQRIHRAVYTLDIRGHDHSGPNLECPEVRAAGPTLAGLRSRDPEHRRLLLEAVTACRDRLAGEGIDLAAYDVAATVGDLEDLRQALGLPLVNVNANLNGSRISSEYVRTYPDAVRVFVMDSPTLASPETLSVAPAAFDLAIENLSSLCATQPACRARFPDLGAAIQEATAKLDAAPVTIEVDGTVEAVKAGHPIKVVVDGAAYLRFVRYTLGAGGGELAAEIVRTTEHVLAGTLSRRMAWRASSRPMAARASGSCPPVTRCRSGPCTRLSAGAWRHRWIRRGSTGTSPVGLRTRTCSAPGRSSPRATCGPPDQERGPPQRGRRTCRRS